MNWGILLAAGGAGAMIGAGAAELLDKARAPVPASAVAAGTACAWMGVVAFADRLPVPPPAPAAWPAVPLVVTALAVPLIAADLRHRRLPDVLTLPAYPLAAAVVPDPARALCAAVVFGGLHLLVHLLAPRAMGAGDVKLAGALGALLGGVGWPALPLAAVLAALVTATLAATKRWGPCVPHGPGLLVATAALTMLGPRAG